MKIRNKLIIGFTAIILFSGAMGFSAVDGIQRTSQLTNELFEYPLMASNFARGAQTAFVRMRVAGNDEPLVTVRENALREDLAIVAERLRDPAGPALIAHIDAGLRNLARLRTARALIAEQGGSLGETLLRQEVAFSSIDEDFESLVELAVVEGFDFMLAAENESTELFNIQIFLVCLMLGLGLGIALYLGRQFARPIQAITAVTSRLAMGDDKVEIPGGRRRDEIGAMARALEIFKENVTTIRQNEAELIRMRDSLEQRVRERTEELAGALQAANAASAAKSEFLATVSHELRTPLNAIIGFSDILRGELFGPHSNAKYREYAKDINESGVLLLDHINEILEFSKIEAGKSELHEEYIEVLPTLDSCLSVVSGRAEKAGIEIERDIAADLPPLFADERKCKQILINLLSNAVKFTPPGGKVTVRIWFRRDNGYIFQITDTGIGIALADIPNTLTPFQQIDSDLNRKYEDTGLGLPLTKTFVEMHGGSLDLQSEVGIGTTVTVRFPAERIAAPSAGPSLVKKSASM
ncbi:MAG: ATP-binding protein [Alphaproteobacteria bacterium]|nr:ATP-binding protein [Alphaproteobacteria bacterium]